MDRVNDPTQTPRPLDNSSAPRAEDKGVSRRQGERGAPGGQGGVAEGSSLPVEVRFPPDLVLGLDVLGAGRALAVVAGPLLSDALGVSGDPCGMVERLAALAALAASHVLVAIATHSHLTERDTAALFDAV